MTFQYPRLTHFDLRQRRMLLLLAAVLAALVLPLLNQQHNIALFLHIQQVTRQLPDSWWYFATELGEAQILLSLLVLWIRLRPEDLKIILLALLVGTVIVHGLKNALDLMRPAAVLGEDGIHIIGRTLRRHSFPSGHTATAFAMATFVFMRTYSSWRYCALLGAAIVGLSRVAVGAHWPMDVVAGASAGIIATVTAHAIAQRWSWQPSERACVGFSVFVLVLTVAMGIQQGPGLHAMAQTLGFH